MVTERTPDRKPHPFLEYEYPDDYNPLDDQTPAGERFSDYYFGIKKIIRKLKLSEPEFLQITDKQTLINYKTAFSNEFTGQRKALEYLMLYFDTYIDFTQAIKNNSDLDTSAKIEKYRRLFEVYKKKVHFEKIVEYTNSTPDNYTFRLELELVPESSSNLNAKNILKESEWKRIRFVTHGIAGIRCEICKGLGTDHPVQCHEVWAYDAKTNIQKLVKFKSLCPLCHDTKHLGNSGLFSNRHRAIDRFIALNNISTSKADDLIYAAENIHSKRSRKNWKVDFSILSLYNLKPPFYNLKPPLHKRIIFNSWLTDEEKNSSDSFDPSILNDIEL